MTMKKKKKKTMFKVKQIFNKMHAYSLFLRNNSETITYIYNKVLSDKDKTSISLRDFSLFVFENSNVDKEYLLRQ
jgi:hypothetical protein